MCMNCIAAGRGSTILASRWQYVQGRPGLNVYRRASTVDCLPERQEDDRPVKLHLYTEQIEQLAHAVAVCRFVVVDVPVKHWSGLARRIHRDVQYAGGSQFAI